LSNPLPIDLGADQLHDRGISGHGVTIAVLDSGVYFNKHVEDILGADLDRQYLGQADFVGSGVCSGTGKQLNGYCFSDHHNSIDRYGHGSHVAGIVWSQIIDYATGVRMGVAPDANILSVRVLNENGEGTYADVIEGLQYVVANRATFNIRVLNLSLSATADVPYFVDPLNRAVEQAWARGIVVVAAAGNTGPGAETITAPGNDPYVITVGAINDNRTPGYWSDDILPSWSATGPTRDGFAKPDVLAPGSNVISFMYTDKNDTNSAKLARLHPDYVRTISLFRMNGTSMATAAASSIVALMLQANPTLTPDQVKFRLLFSARPALSATSDAVYNTLQQGMGRIWAPDAVLGEFPTAGAANADMDINADLAHGWATDVDLAYHYQGPIRSMLSDDGSAYLYYVTEETSGVTALGVARPNGTWVDYDTMASARMTWAGARMTWAGGMTWAGSTDAFASARMTWAGARMTWAGARMTWAGARMTWAGARMTWAGARMTWAGGMTWAGSTDAFASARMTWAGSMKTSSTGVSSTTWVGDW
jgi:serine protease AprX